MNRRRWLEQVALAALVGVVASAAQAQYATLEGSACRTNGIGMVNCLTPDVCLPDTCVVFQGGAARCVALNSMLCCVSNLDCPLDATTPEPLSCQQVSGISNGNGVCLPDRPFCNASGTAITYDELVACYSINAQATTSWGAGDCDGDLVPNGMEQEAGGDPCGGAPNLAYWNGTQCEPVTTGCTPGAGCGADGSGICTTVTVGSTICVPGNNVLFCGGTYTCPPGTSSQSVGDSVHVCVNVICLDTAGIDPTDCVTDANGTLVAFDNGDCDLDLVPNVTEIENGQNPCGAGAIMDGGSSRDGGSTPLIPIQFAGGGGCICRASPAPSGAPLWIALALVLLRRRDRRPCPRRS